MQTPIINQQTLLTVVRAARPSFRNRYDRLAFAVHAYNLADDYKLVGTGKAAEVTIDLKEDAPEVGLEGWTAVPNCYTFHYVDAAGKRPSRAVKAVVVSDNLLVHWLCPSSHQPPKSITLGVQAYTNESPDLARGYQNLDDFDLPAGPSYHAPAGHARYGSDDVVPPGFRPPGVGPDPYGGIGGAPAMPGMGGGGMHMGPGDPLFAGRMRQPGRGGAMPPGARWDPIRPPGMEGFNPGDFQRPGRGAGGLHPDLAQPAPGSTDWESMYG
ncbi:hypothetical protein WJX73_004976 [Symbiochloris irregularis]|uniref:Proteasome inhibitor PI31 subunit n=1 Tax=Symbiochloris irregularis TaxID=706552 RepID=A0AAW1P9D2_9CHLO